MQKETLLKIKVKIWVANRLASLARILEEEESRRYLIRRRKGRSQLLTHFWQLSKCTKHIFEGKILYFLSFNEHSAERRRRRAMRTRGGIGMTKAWAVMKTFSFHPFQTIKQQTQNFAASSIKKRYVVITRSILKRQVCLHVAGRLREVDVSKI